jgi:hypothetical protein
VVLVVGGGGGRGVREVEGFLFVDKIRYMYFHYGVGHLFVWLFLVVL